MYTCPKCGKNNVTAIDKFDFVLQGKVYGVALKETKRRGDAEITEAVAVHFPHNRYCWDCDYEWEDGVEDE